MTSDIFPVISPISVGIETSFRRDCDKGEQKRWQLLLVGIETSFRRDCDIFCSYSFIRSEVGIETSFRRDCDMGRRLSIFSAKFSRNRDLI